MTRLKQITPPDLVDVLEAVQETIFSSLNCHQVGVIEAFNVENQTATVSIALKQITNETGQEVRSYSDYAPLLEVPVIVLGGGNSRLTFPIQQGDECLLLFNDRELDNWFTNDELQAPSELRKHDFSDAIALVGLSSLQNRIQDYLEDGTDWRYNATRKITQTATDTTISNTNINLNGNIRTEVGDTTHTGITQDVTIIADNGTHNFTFTRGLLTGYTNT